jgi:hypothetical protein
MGAGRAAAQASHAANAFIHAFGNPDKLNRAEVRDWQRQTKQGFGTAIVVGVTKDQIEKLFSRAPLKRWIMKGKVYDPDYVILVNPEVAELMQQNYDGRFCNFTFDYRTAKDVAIHRNEMTCAFVFGEADDEELAEIRKLPLYAS